MSENIFVYGTLHPDRAPEEIAHVVRRFRTVGTGTIRARLHKFHDYPAIKVDPRGPDVPGEVFQIPSAQALRELDVYEEYDPATPDKNLFRRRQVEVHLHDGSTVDSWVYEYNKELPSTDVLVENKGL